MSKSPQFYQEVAARHPELVRAYEALSDAARKGPLDPLQSELVKLALAAGARLDGGVRAHTRRALDAGATPEALEHLALLAVTTLGWPGAMAILSTIRSEIEKQGNPRP